MVLLVTQSLSNFWLSDLDYSSNFHYMFSTILPSILFCLDEYLTNTNISPTVPITSRRIVQFFVSDLITRLESAPNNELPELSVVQQGFVWRPPIVASSSCSLRYTSGHGNRVNLIDTLRKCP